jgi:phosphoesterase RecJ-like protein
MKDKFLQIRNIIENHDNFLLTTHLLPDGDAIGSELALAEYLKKKSKNVFIINHSSTPDYLEFLDKYKHILTFRHDVDKNSGIIKNSEVIFLVDTNEFSRTKSMEKYLLNSNALKICIDHHLDLKESVFDAFISNTEYPATSQILYDFICDDDSDFIDEYVAVNLYAGIMTDTGSFRYPRTNERTFIICSSLIRKGADPVKIFDIIYSNSPKNKILLLARFINSFKFYYDDRLIIGVVTQSDFDKFKLEVQDIEGFSSFTMTIKNVGIGILLVELNDKIKVSLRSKGNINVNVLAKKIGGGGHKNAAGATVTNMNLETLLNFIIENSKEILS